ncbi:MAG: protein containing YHS domain protein, partial [Patescibacteria group bacterium]
MQNSLLNNSKHVHNQIKICVSGAAETGHCGVDALDKAKELGREIARQGAILVTGATTGFPFWVSMGAKEEGGVSIGFSPAASEREHVEVFKLPIDYMDLIIYTGFGYPGRDLLLTRSVDAVICGCGRVGTIHEFTVAFEDGKVIGIFEGPWEMGDELKDIV